MARKTDTNQPAKPRKPRVPRTKKPVGATEEIERTEPERAPLPDPTGLAHTLSPVDLPDPAAPLPRPLRWTSIAIAVATLTLFLLNAHALRSWAYQLPPSDASARVVILAESWYDMADRAGLNRPVEAMHGWWQSAKDARFGGRVAPPDRAAADLAAAPPSGGAQR
jgi:hypothetical protein